MSVLVLAEIVDGVLALDATAKTISAASGLGDITILCCGENVQDAASAAAKFENVAKVLVADDGCFAHQLAEPISELVAHIASDFAFVIAPATAATKNILPRVAALMDVMIISDVQRIVAPDTFERPIYAGNAIQTVKSKDHLKILTVRTTAFAPATVTTNAASIEQVDFTPTTTAAQWISDQMVVSDRPELTAAKIVVSGGRALGSRENFALIEKLADKLGAAIGASRAAVDSDYISNEAQVGQTGQVVAPELYIAVGISGAIQHLAGMKESKLIVAINNDEEAPIFQIADIGLVADLFDAVPELTSKL